jgi:hypothetical protein
MTDHSPASSRGPHRQDPDAHRLFAELAAGIVRAEIKRRDTSAKAVPRATPEAKSSVQAFLDGHGISLDCFAAMARCAGYELVLREMVSGCELVETEAKIPGGPEDPRAPAANPTVGSRIPAMNDPQHPTPRR